MYQRIKNKLDMEIIKSFLESEQTDQNVVRRMEELTDILDGAYGGSRGAFDMGGYILFFGDRQTYEDHIAKIMEFYHLDRDLAEYSRQRVRLTARYNGGKNYICYHQMIRLC